MDVIYDAFDATMCQKKTQSRNHHQRSWSRIDGQESTASDEVPG